MVDRLHLTCEFIFDASKSVLLSLEASYQRQPVSLVLSNLMAFLFEHESRLHKDDLEFGYLLAKCVKKVQLGGQFLLAVPDDYSMALVFKKAAELGVELVWKKTGKAIKTELPLPL